MGCGYLTALSTKTLQSQNTHTRKLQKEPIIPQLFMYYDLAKLLQKGLAKEGRFSERLSIF